MNLQRATFIDPERVTERLFGGPHFITGYISPDGTRYYSDDRKKMWFVNTVAACAREGLNYEGHKIS